VSRRQVHVRAFGQDFLVGDAALKERARLRINHPIEAARINNWDDMEKIWYHCFYDALKVTPEDHPVRDGQLRVCTCVLCVCVSAHVGYVERSAVGNADGGALES